jgi:hypothetical protein
LGTWIPVLGAGVAYTAVFVICQLFYVYKADPLTDPLGLLKAKLEARRS